MVFGVRRCAYVINNICRRYDCNMQFAWNSYRERVYISVIIQYVSSQLKSGLLHYSYNGETMFLPSTTLADGSWHRIEIKWLGTDISVSIDYGLRTALLPMLANKIQGQYIGKILIGGLDTTAGLLASDVGYFEGCIQVS